MLGCGAAWARHPQPRPIALGVPARAVLGLRETSDANSWLSGGEFGAEGGLVFGIALVVGYLYFRRTQRVAPPEGTIEFAR